MPEPAVDDPPDLAAAATAARLPPLYEPSALPVSAAPSVVPPAASPPAGPPSFEVPPEITSGLAALKRREMEAKEAEATRTFAGLSRDQARAEQAFNASGVGPHDIEKWDADTEFARRQSDPLERFGSLASVIGILGAAFTHQPLVNSLNASAAAMEAIRAGEKESYERAHAAWKDNSDLVIKRANLMHQHYQDAVELMRTNLAAGEAKMRVTATQFGDKQALFLIENGMSADLLSLIEKRNRAALDYAQHVPVAMEATEKAQDLAERTRGLKRGTPEYDAAVKAHYAAFDPYAQRQHSLSADQEFTRKWWEQNPKGTSEQFAEAYGEFKKGQKEEKPLTSDQEFNDRYWEQHPDATAEDYSKAYGEFKRGQKPPPSGAAGGNTSLTIQRQNAQAAAQYKQELLAEGKTEKEAEEGRVRKYAELTSKATPVPAGKATDIRLANDRLQRASDKIDALEKMMVRHGAITGLGGMVRRPAETMIDILGGDATAAKEFRANIVELQQWVSQVIDNKISAGRPLSVAELRVQEIVPALRPGDTVQFVTKQLRTLQEDLRAMKRDNEAILNKEPAGGGSPPPPAGKEKPAWQRLGVPSPSSP